MYCSNCGEKTNPTDIFCTQCGTKISNNIFKQPTITDDNYLKAYIGNKYDQMINGGISGWTFLFGIFYTLYRKMWLITANLALLNLLTIIYLPTELSNIINLIINIIVACYFKKWYTKICKERIDKIKQDNPEKNPEEILKICEQKGGTSDTWTLLIIIPAILGLIAGFLSSLQ